MTRNTRCSCKPTPELEVQRQPNSTPNPALTTDGRSRRGEGGSPPSRARRRVGTPRWPRTSRARRSRSARGPGGRSARTRICAKRGASIASRRSATCLARDGSAPASLRPPPGQRPTPAEPAGYGGLVRARHAPLVANLDAVIVRGSGPAARAGPPSRAAPWACGSAMEVSRHGLRRR